MLPIKQRRNRVWRSYKGGFLLDEWQGNPGADGDTPEEWVGSVIEARGKNRPAGEGLSVMVTSEGDIPLKDLIEAAPAKYIGKRILAEYGSPALLTKMLDSKERLSVQVHPTRAAAKKYFNSRFGKTEGWYILNTREIGGEPAYIYLGFKEGVTEAYWRDCFFNQATEAMLNCLHKVYVKSGDCFLVEGGTPHAIGSGCFLLEIQEPTDYTMRVEKTAPSGAELDEILLHQGIGFENMLRCFTYTGCSREVMLEKWKSRPIIISDTADFTHTILLDSYYFVLEEMIVKKTAVTKKTDSFYNVIVYDGSGEVDGMPVKKGDALFVPHAADDCRWVANCHLSLLICRPPAASP